jgi:cathepsin A (carboxypeptidase C)
MIKSLTVHRYLDVGYGKDLFFYFFESRSKPKEDPVVMWINGTPPCFSHQTRI